MSNTTVDWDNNGYNNSVVVSANKTLTAADQGVVQDVQASCTITIPTSFASADFKVRVGAPGITVVVTPQATDTIQGGGFASPGAAKSLHFTSQNAGSKVELIGGAANTYNIAALDGAPTLS